MEGPLLSSRDGGTRFPVAMPARSRKGAGSHAGQALGVSIVSGLGGLTDVAVSLWAWACASAALVLLHLCACSPSCAALLLVLQGLLLGSGGWLLVLHADPLVQGLCLAVLIVCVVGAVPALAARLGVYACFALAVLGPPMLEFSRRWIRQGDETESLQRGLVLAALGILTAWAAWNAFRPVLRVDRLQVESAHLRRRVRRQSRVVMASRRRAEHLDRARTQFLAATSHDLRQPLYAVLLFAQMLRDRLHDARDRRLADRLHEGLRSLDDLMGDVLDLSRLEAGVLQAAPRAVELAGLYARLRPHVEGHAASLGLRLRFHGGHRVVLADPLMLERVLRNLVANALQHTTQGGIVVGCRPRGGQMLVQVWDSGSGIPPGHLGPLFDDIAPPARADQAAEPSLPRGRGMGLAIVRRITLAMGTRVVVRSVHGKGSVFEFAVPTAAPLRVG